MSDQYINFLGYHINKSLFMVGYSVSLIIFLIITFIIGVVAALYAAHKEVVDGSWGKD